MSLLEIWQYLTEQLVGPGSLEMMAEIKSEEKVRAKFSAQEKSHRLLFIFSDSQASFLSKQEKKAVCEENSTILNSKSCKKKNISNCFHWRTCDTFSDKRSRPLRKPQYY